MPITRRYTLTGVVQGVSFRVSTQHKALSLGISGWVRNCRDGAVEVCATAEESQLQEFESWLRQGPPHARVDAVAVENLQPHNFREFEIRY